jgi:hypothetical protein
MEAVNKGRSFPYSFNSKVLPYCITENSYVFSKSEKSIFSPILIL